MECQRHCSLQREPFFLWWKAGCRVQLPGNCGNNENKKKKFTALHCATVVFALHLVFSVQPLARLVHVVLAVVRRR